MTENTDVKKILKSERQAISLMAVSIFLCVLLLIIYYFFVKNKIENCFTNFLILILFSASIALFIFGGIEKAKSTGSFTGKLFGLDVTFGGPAALLLIIVLIGKEFIPCIPPGATLFDYSVFLKDSMNRPIANLNPTATQLKLKTGGNYMTEFPKDPLTGLFRFEDIPIKYKDQKLQIDLKSDEYVFMNNSRMDSIILAETDNTIKIKLIADKVLNDSSALTDTSFSLNAPGNNQSLSALIHDFTGYKFVNSSAMYNIKITYTGEIRQTENGIFRYGGDKIIILVNNNFCAVCPAYELPARHGLSKSKIIEYIDSDISSYIRLHQKIILKQLLACI